MGEVGDNSVTYRWIVLGTLSGGIVLQGILYYLG